MLPLTELVALAKKDGHWNHYDHKTINLAELYGPNFKLRFKAMIRNIRDYSYMNEAHHCSAGEAHKATKRCFSVGLLHLGYCTAAIEDENNKAVICGERFKINSHGCAKHPYPRANMVFKELQRGKRLDGAAKGIYQKTPEEVAAKKAEEEKKAQELADRDHKAWETLKHIEAKKARDLKTPRASTTTKGKNNITMGYKEYMKNRKTKQPVN